MIEGISFLAQVYKVTTIVDGGWRVSFDVSQDESDSILALSRLMGDLIQVGIVNLPKESSG